MLAGLKAMRTDGTIENVSLGMNAHRKHMGRWTPSVIIDLIDAVPEGTIDSALLAYGWNLLCQDGLEVMVKCQQAGIAVHIAGTFGGDALYLCVRLLHGAFRHRHAVVDLNLGGNVGAQRTKVVAVDNHFVAACR